MLLQRFQAEAGLAIVRLPLGTPPGKPHVPILVSSSSPSPRGPLLARKKRIVLVVNEAVQDLGVFAYRIVGGEGKGAISRGSALELAKLLPEYRAAAATATATATAPNSPDASDTAATAAIAANNDNDDDNVDDDETPGLVVTNPGQLLWWRGGQEAVTFRTWGSLPRATAVHGPMRIDEARNRVSGQRSAAEHLRYVFEEVLGGGGSASSSEDGKSGKGGVAVAPDARIYVIAVADGAGDAVAYLNENCTNLFSCLPVSLSASVFCIPPSFFLSFFPLLPSPIRSSLSLSLSPPSTLSARRT